MTHFSHPVNDLQRSAYLEAIGIDRYVSRYPLPGAAVTARPAPGPHSARTPASKPEPVEVLQPVEAPAPFEAQVAAPVPAPSPSLQESPSRAAVAASEDRPRFSIAAIAAGGWLWVEELAGMPLTREQVQLVQAMASALQRRAGASTVVEPAARPEIAQFDWPMHNNQQLDLGRAAASAALASFLGRRLEQRGLGLVLMGASTAERIPLQALACPQVVLRHSSADLLANPELKQEAWSDLKAFLQRA